MWWAFSNEWLGVMTLQHQKRRGFFFFYISVLCIFCSKTTLTASSQETTMHFQQWLCFLNFTNQLNSLLSSVKSKPAKLSQVCTFFGMVSTHPLRLFFLHARTAAQVSPVLLFQICLSCTVKQNKAMDKWWQRIIWSNRTAGKVLLFFLSRIKLKASYRKPMLLMWNFAFQATLLQLFRNKFFREGVYFHGIRR